jgi:hypothetical protein
MQIFIINQAHLFISMIQQSGHLLSLSIIVIRNIKNKPHQPNLFLPNILALEISGTENGDG